jgi:hypothetical protein
MKFYRTIEELPIWNFDKINEQGDVRYMLKLDDYFELPEIGIDYDTLVDHFIQVSDELFERFGVDDRAITNMMEEKDILIIKLKWLAGEKAFKTRYKIKSKIREDRESMVGDKKQTFEEKIIMLESYFKKDFDVYKMSVAKFYTYLDVFKRANK